MTARPPGTGVVRGPVDPYVPTRGNRGYMVTRYELDLDYRVATNRLAGRARVLLTATQDLEHLGLDLTGLRVGDVRVDGRRPRAHAHRRGKLTITLGERLRAGASAVVDIDYTGTPRPAPGPWGDVGWEELTDGVIVAGQPDGASTWFPCNDHPSDKATLSLRLATDPGYTVVGNGALVGRTTRAGRVVWAFEQAEPMATYLATVQVGRYTVLETAAGPVPQHAVVPARLRTAVLHDLGRQADMMALFVRLFGPYPFDEYQVVVTDDALEMPLEAQGMSVFGANHVDGRRGAERLVAHELAHQWFGNSLTVASWQHIWLHEGFACYAEWLWSEGSGGPAAHTLATQAWDRLARQPQDLRIGDPGPQRMFDDRVYKRGALTVHAVRLALGDVAFFDMLRTWTRTHAYGNVTTEDFVDCVRRHTDVPVDALFDAWLGGTRLPRLVRTPDATPAGGSSGSGQRA